MQLSEIGEALQILNFIDAIEVEYEAPDFLELFEELNVCDVAIGEICFIDSGDILLASYI